MEIKKVWILESRRFNSPTFLYDPSGDREGCAVTPDARSATRFETKEVAEAHREFKHPQYKFRAVQVGFV